MDKNIPPLIFGNMYRVTMRDWQNKVGRPVLRIYKGTENRELPGRCFVFSSRVPKGTVVEKNEDKSITITGTQGKIPMSEVSVPPYDLMKVEAV